MYVFFLLFFFDSLVSEGTMRRVSGRMKSTTLLPCFNKNIDFKEVQSLAVERR